MPSACTAIPRPFKIISAPSPFGIAKPAANSLQDGTHVEFCENRATATGDSASAFALCENRLSCSRCKNAGKRFGPRVLFLEANWLIRNNEKTALVGANGTGKSTLMKVLAGLETLDYGSLEQTRGISIGYLPQEGLQLAGRTVFEECLTVFDELHEMERGNRAAWPATAGRAGSPEPGVQLRGRALLPAAGSLSRARWLRARRAGGQRAHRPRLRQGGLGAADR